MARIIRRAHALADLLDLHDYVTEQSGDVVADAVIRRIEERLTLLAQYPQMGRKRDELRPGLRSLVIDRHIAFYLPMEDGIDLVRVLYGGRDIPTLFAEDV
jgi:toxin ParE1/3/4